ncbi:hypothetical protein GCM10022261_03020 [Brevibacterium daeguense]|uniref:HTH asnC-type domain-containing protein n=1 Tax=Brevibacterium daeguense TaxID=909936 RepID=A0ABP8EFS7_9MICO|nr:Lrp/AsnC family transcriptional regulator [Brevibacterium daeguense]
MAVNTRRPDAGAHRSARKEIDDIDLQILELLVQDPRRSQRSLAKDIGLSPPAIADRIAQLEEAGVIEGYTTKINLAKLGYSMTVFAEISCELGPEHREQSRQLSEIDEVEKVILTTGAHDLLIKINVRDREHLNEVLFEKLIEGQTKIYQSNTRVSLGEFERPDYHLGVLRQIRESRKDPSNERDLPD